MSWCFSTFLWDKECPLFPKIIIMTCGYFALSCYTLACPIKWTVDKYKGHLVFWRQTVRSVTIFDNYFSDRTFIVRLCFGDKKLIQNVLHKTVVWLFVWELILITWNINLAFRYNRVITLTWENYKWTWNQFSSTWAWRTWFAELPSPLWSGGYYLKYNSEILLNHRK